MSEDHNTGWRKRQIALEKMAENARELGLNYEPSKTVVDMATEAGLIGKPVFRDGLERFAALVASAEPVAYSKLCEQEPVQYKCTVIDSQYPNGTPHTRVGLFEIVSGKFQEGRTKAFAEIAEKIKLMPWENDTKDSFLVWLKEQA